MRIVLVNKFYYPRGGDCIYTMALERLLKSRGNEVAIFSTRDSRSYYSEWSKYWPREMKLYDIFSRPFGSADVIGNFHRLLNDFRPDVVHVNNIHTQISPVVVQFAKSYGARVVWTLHDTKLVCPAYSCMRNGKWCESCFNDKRSVLRHRCMRGGIVGSWVGYREILHWNPSVLQSCVDAFIAPSRFMADCCIRGGYSSDKFYVLHNFMESERLVQSHTDRGNYYLYFGRLNRVKGVERLCEAAMTLPYNLVVAGSGELERELRIEYEGSERIRFVGHCDWQKLRPLISGARFVVVPSEWSENNPLSIIESLTLGTPVLGADIGGIPEMLTDECGMIFTSGQVDELRSAISEMFERSFDYRKIASNAMLLYSDDQYYEELMKIYTDCNGKEVKWNGNSYL